MNAKSIRVALFASARQAVNAPFLSVHLEPPHTVDVLLATLARDARLSGLISSLRVAVNEEFASSDAVLDETMDVALIPPVAGGALQFEITASKLSVDRAIEAVTTPKHGAIVTFVGVVRNETAAKHVLRLDYEAYAPMAGKKMAQIAEETAERWPGVLLSAQHRVGTLQPTEAAVVLAVSAAHRKAAFEACQYFMQRLKQDVPIWKKEVFEDGETWVSENP